MSRKIFISSDISVDDRLIEVSERSPIAALMWPWLLTAFDDWGRAEASTKRLKAQVFPAQATITTELIEEALTLYAEVGLIQLYAIGERRYMAIPTEKWFSYQTHIRSEKRERQGSRIPAPERDDARDEPEPRADARNPAQPRADARLARAGAPTPHHTTPHYTTPSPHYAADARARETTAAPSPNGNGSSGEMPAAIRAACAQIARMARPASLDRDALAQQLGPHRARDPAWLVAQASAAREWADEHRKPFTARLIGNWLNRTARQEEQEREAAANNHATGGTGNGTHQDVDTKAQAEAEHATRLERRRILLGLSDMAP